MLSDSLSRYLDTPQQSKTGGEGEKVSKRGEAPLLNILPPLLPREGDKGGGLLKN